MRYTYKHKQTNNKRASGKANRQKGEETERYIERE
jgi:hypothetical protein